MKRLVSMMLLLGAVVVAGLNGSDSDGNWVFGQRRPGRTAALSETELANLHQAAVDNGGRLIRNFNPVNASNFRNLSELAGSSDAVLVGRVARSRNRFAADQNDVSTELIVSVQQVLAGDLKHDGAIEVRAPGGSHIFPDGTSVHLNPLNYRRANEGAAYLFFLRKNEQDESYSLTGEVKGQFELDFEADQVWPSELAATGSLAKKYTGRRIPEFLVELREALSSR